MGDTRGKFILFIVLLVVLHFVLRLGLLLGDLAPDLLVVALLLAARRLRPGWAAGLGVALGLLEGAVTFTIGVPSLVLALLGYLAARSREFLSGDGPLQLAGYLFLGKWLYDALLMGVLAWSDLAPPVSSLVVVSLPAALYAAVAGLAAMAAYRSVT